MTSRNNNITYICFLYILGIFHLTLFLYEFFPVKTKYYGDIIQPPTHINGTSLNPGKHYRSDINRVIFMVIDALRNDFINQQNMPFIYDSIQKSGCHITTKVESPTVTMPRIKAMTTGTLPQYIDILLNFQSVEVTEDSWLQRAKESGKKIVFYGDNTWEKLYPDMFHRSEGTTSFFVTDFTEVDDNVTRHLSHELQHKKDWDILILHYLGLDHIGHIHGPFHHLINTKLNEMDDIVKTIHSYLQDQENTVIIISGDHGMRDLGGHGGSTEPEILVPFVVLNYPCRKYRNYEAKQTDIPATLAALMALEMPAQSVGKIIHDFLPYRTKTQNLYYLHYNALNLIKMDPKYLGEFDPIFRKHVEYLTNNYNNTKQLISLYEEKIVEISDGLLRSSTMDQNILILYSLVGSLILICFGTLRQSNLILYFSNFLINLSLSMFRNYYINLIYSVFLSGLIIYSSVGLIQLKKSTSKLYNLMLLGTMFRTLSLLSSSYIEFEQQIWYFLWTSVCVYGSYLNYPQKSFEWVVLGAGLRIARNIKLLEFYGISFITGLVGIVYMTKDHLSIVSTIAIFTYKYYQSVLVAQIAKCLILISCFWSLIKHDLTKTLIVTWLLWSALLMRPFNVILLPICLIGSRIIFQLNSSIEVVTLMHIWLEEILYYCQGFDNNFSSVDISPGYVGLNEYSLIYTSFQVLCHTYVFRILPILLLFQKQKEKDRVLHIFIIYRLTSFTYYCLVMLVHKNHIFIWSVFSPKLLIESCHGLLLFFVILFRCFVRK